jgi:hypothetical protein
MVELTFCDNIHSLYGKMKVTSANQYDSDRLYLSMEIERDDKDTDTTIKNEINRQIRNQNKIGVSGYATIKILRTFSPANKGELVVRRKALKTESEPSSQPETQQTEVQDVSSALEGSKYEVIVEGKTGDMQITHIHFGDVNIKTDIDITTGNIHVRMMERGFNERIANSVFAGAARIASIPNYLLNRTKTSPVSLVGRKIASKYVVIEKGAVEYKEFSDLAEKLGDIHDSKQNLSTTIDGLPQDRLEKAVDKPMPMILGVVRLLGPRGSALGLLEHLDYDDKDVALRFTILDPEYSSGNGSDKNFRRDQIFFRAKFAIGAIWSEVA